MSKQTASYYAWYLIYFKWALGDGKGGTGVSESDSAADRAILHHGTRRKNTLRRRWRHTAFRQHQVAKHLSIVWSRGWHFWLGLSSRLETWWILSKNFERQNIFQKYFKSKYLAWFWRKNFQVKIFGWLLSKKFSIQNIWPKSSQILWLSIFFGKIKPNILTWKFFGKSEHNMTWNKFVI